MGTAYGDWLREQRAAAGLTQEQLAEQAIMSRTHIAHIEAGRRVPSKEDARRLDQVLNTGGALSNFRPGNDRRPVAAHFEAALELEQQASMIREFALSFVPGFLQTEAYADAVLRDASFPPLVKEERAKAVATRLDRGRILEDPRSPMVWALLDEMVLRRPIGGPEVMAHQIIYLVRLVEDERIRLHVVPLSHGGHPLLGSMVTLMWFEDQPPVAYEEGAFAGTVHDEPNLVQRIQAAYALVLGEALPQKESLDLMRSIAEEYGHHD
ncbi:transcriptional regulator with XRE-family HTH domain [Streptomyces griseochromogenes]|uniref:Transcriptional regulator n=1 Tax=Streptomyces griseochromogenes TaxID=68214 RepID=A0A1B1ARL9_9ACTN|nr:helix-turn-helix transcriptional regulator [Streptomyces griseochromogenes]ANP49204.1 transcriptional regulator [Streptomyces griseochromogenes]MBP2049251.1 transcriptional regulator with XRE-family HTH domain [Streptomyces griseochromogenes]